MPKITEVIPQKSSKGRSASGRNSPRRFNIFLDDAFAFGADEDLVVEYRLVPEKIIDQTMLEKLLFEAAVGKLMERMYRLFNIRQRSEKEVRDYFRIKNLEFRIKQKEQISDLAVELLIKKLKQKGLLNDEEFAKAWVEARSKKKGLQAIKGELFKKGIDREIIEEVTQSEGLESKQLDTATKLLLKRLPRFKNLPPLEKRKKAYEFLLRRGFDYETVSHIIENILKKS